MSNKDYFQLVPNATSFQVLDHVTWNNNLQMRLAYFQPLVNGSSQRVKLSFSQSLVSSTTQSTISGGSYTAVIANTDMWNGTSLIYLPQDGVYAITSQNSFNGTGNRRLFNIRLYGNFGVLFATRPMFYENTVANDTKSVDVVFNAYANFAIDLAAFQNSGSTLTISGDIYVQKMSEVFEV